MADEIIETNEGGTPEWARTMQESLDSLKELLTPQEPQQEPQQEPEQDPNAPQEIPVPELPPQEIPEPDPLKDPEPEEKPKKKPEAPNKNPPQKKKPAPKKKQDAGFSSDQITALIVSMSSIAASRPGMEMWMLTEVEAKQIADPLANMIAKSEKLSQAGEYADAIALVTACIVLFVPRWMMYAETKKQKKIAQNGGATLVRQEKKGAGNDGKPAVKNARPAEVNADSIFAAIPPSI